MYDTDLVQRVVEYFLMHEQHQLQQQAENAGISKLLDNYLGEIARDPNLSVSKFQVLAELLPENARSCHDGLYRAIDVYLKVTSLATFLLIFALFSHIEYIARKIMECLPIDSCFVAGARSETLVQDNELQQIVSGCLFARCPK